MEGGNGEREEKVPAVILLEALQGLRFQGLSTSGRRMFIRIHNHGLDVRSHT